MSNLRSVKELKLSAKTRVVLRVDFNVPVKDGQILETFRIKKSLPTIKLLLKNKAPIRIISHLDRPGGKFVPSLSMRPIANYLARVLNRKIIFLNDPTSIELFRKYSNSPRIIFFENIRFWKGEKKNELSFAKALSRWGDIYVNEAFADSHRRHASIAAITKFLPSFAGIYLEQEVDTLENIFNRIKRPFIAMLGGAKTTTKLPLVRRFLKEADRLLVGGELANTILHIKGIEVGRSLIDTKAKDCITRSVLNNKKLLLPVDVVVANSLEKKSAYKIKTVGKIGRADYIVDIGPETVGEFSGMLKKAKMVVWNGPFGFIEKDPFWQGSVKLARALVQKSTYTVVGGGDTIALLERFRLLRGFNHISSGGGAMLELLAGKSLPGVEVLKRK